MSFEPLSRVKTCNGCKATFCDPECIDQHVSPGCHPRRADQSPAARPDVDHRAQYWALRALVAVMDEPYSDGRDEREARAWQRAKDVIAATDAAYAAWRDQSPAAQPCPDCDASGFDIAPNGLPKGYCQTCKGTGGLSPASDTQTDTGGDRG